MSLATIGLIAVKKAWFTRLWYGGFLGFKMPLNWLKIGLNSVEKLTLLFVSTTPKLMWKSNSPLTNCCNLVVKDGRSSGA